MKGIIDTIPFIGVRGDVLIETRDAKSGKLAQRSEGHNLFTNYGLERFRKSCAGIIGCQYGSDMYFNEGHLDEALLTGMNSANAGIMKYLYLTDNANAITASMSKIPGALTGYATRATYTGTDVARGSVNINECQFTPNKLKAVFDFATDKANGIHKSVFWADRAMAEANCYWSLEDSGLEARLARQYIYVAESDDGYFYGVSGTTLYKIDPTTLTEIATYTLPATPGAIFDVAGGYCYFTTGINLKTLYIFKLSDSSSTNITLPVASNSYGGAVIDGYLYYPYSNSSIYKVNATTAESENKTVTLPNYGYVFRRGSQLYYTCDGSALYTYDYITNTLTATSVFIPETGSYLCNTYSLAGALWYNRVITSYYNGGTSVTNHVLQKLNLSKETANMITGKLLDSPIEKLNTQTMKVTYTISFV